MEAHKVIRYHEDNTIWLTVPSTEKAPESIEDLKKGTPLTESQADLVISSLKMKFPELQVEMI